MSGTTRSNNLQRILKEEGLSYAELQRLCASTQVVSAQTLRDLASGKRRGNLRSWERIVTALNRRSERKKEYVLADLLGPEYEGL